MGTELRLISPANSEATHLLLPASKLLSVELLKRVEQLLLHFLYRLHAL
jgi:hypothetical protein